MDTAALARQLTELDKVATPIKWVEDDGSLYGPTGGFVESVHYIEPDGPDGDLICALRNNLPAILRALCVMAAVEEGMDELLNMHIHARADELLAKCTGAK